MNLMLARGRGGATHLLIGATVISPTSNCVNEKFNQKFQTVFFFYKKKRVTLPVLLSPAERSMTVPDLTFTIV